MTNLRIFSVVLAKTLRCWWWEVLIVVLYIIASSIRTLYFLNNLFFRMECKGLIKLCSLKDIILELLQAIQYFIVLIVRLIE